MTLDFGAYSIVILIYKNYLYCPLKTRGQTKFKIERGYLMKNLIHKLTNLFNNKHCCCCCGCCSCTDCAEKC